jgi:hypothetical protein
MPILDLFDVTRVVNRTLEHALESRLPGRNISVTNLAPGEVAAGTSNRLNCYLYHVVEPAHSRGAGHGFEAGDRSELPLKLVLHYVVTAHHGAPNGDTAPDEEHLLLGLALKTLHDHASIDRRTLQPGSGSDTLFAGTDLALAEERLELTVEPLEAEKAAALWTALQQPQRSAGFLEVGVVNLEPEPPRRRTGPVDVVDLALFPGFGPQLTGSRSTVVFDRPGMGEQQIDVTPAVVVRGDADQAAPPGAAPDPDPSEIRLYGTGLAGERRLLQLRRDAVVAGLDLDQDQVAAPPANRHWRPTATSTTVTAAVHPLLVDAETGTTVRLAPGAYQAQVVLVGPPRSGGRPPARRPSNAVVVALAPRIVQVAPSGDPRFPWRIDLDGPDAGRTDGRPDHDILVSVAGEVYEDYFTAVAPNPAGNRPPPPDDLSVVDLRGDHLLLAPRAGSRLDGPAPGETIPIGVLVNGVAAPPTWLVAP